MKKVNMNNYKVIGTSTKKYIDNYIEFFSDRSVNDYFYHDSSDYMNHRIEIGNKVFSLMSKTTFQQNIDCWMALGLISISRDKYLINYVSSSLIDIVDFSKMYMLEYSENERINMFRWTKIVNTLVLDGYVTKQNMKTYNIKQKNGVLTIEKILKECSVYEKELLSDKRFVKRLKEKINE